MSTIRSGRASGASASSSATFVSGPVGTSVTAPSRARIASAMKLTACSAARRPRGGGSSGPSSPLSPWTCAATDGGAHERPLGAGRDRHVAATGELEHAQRVRRRLVERLVAGDGRDAEQLELGRGEREQERDRVVVAGVAVEDDRRRCSAATSSTSARARERALRAERGGRAGAGGAGAAQRLRVARPSSSETTRQAVKASPAPVPSTRDDRARAPRATSTPSS